MEVGKSASTINVEEAAALQATVKSYCGKHLRIHLVDGRCIVGRFSALDSFGNILLTETVLMHPVPADADVLRRYIGAASIQEKHVTKCCLEA